MVNVMLSLLILIIRRISEFKLPIDLFIIICSGSKAVEKHNQEWLYVVIKKCKKKGGTRKRAADAVLWKPNLLISDLEREDLICE